MIKGTLKEKQEYECYIREREYTLEPHLYRLYTKTRALRRLIKINAHRENRELSDAEIHELNFLNLIANCGLFCLDLFQTWIWSEALPSVIASVPLKTAQFYVSYQNIAEIFLPHNRRVLVAALLKANVNNSTLVNALAAYDKDDATLLAKSLEEIPLNDLFSQYVLVNTIHEFFKLWIEFDNLEDDGNIDTSVFRSGYQDLLDLDVKDVEKNDILDRITDTIHKINNYPFEGIDASLVKKVCIALKVMYGIFEDELGKTDPIVETVKKIIERDIYQQISQMYVDLERDQQEITEFIIDVYKLIGFFSGCSQEELNELDNLTLDECENENVDKRRLSIHNGTRRLDFPTRISRNRNMDLNVKGEILDGLFSAFGYSFENEEGRLITIDEFKYLFGGPGGRPLNYKTPYYWNQSEKQFAGLLRLLYFGQETGIDEIILLVDDKGKSKSSVKWSARKQGLGKRTLQPIEDCIQNVVEKATGKRLPAVDLTKLNKPKKKFDSDNEKAET